MAGGRRERVSSLSDCPLISYRPSENSFQPTVTFWWCTGWLRGGGGAAVGFKTAAVSVHPRPSLYPPSALPCMPCPLLPPPRLSLIAKWSMRSSCTPPRARAQLIHANERSWVRLPVREFFVFYFLFSAGGGLWDGRGSGCLIFLPAVATPRPHPRSRSLMFGKRDSPSLLFLFCFALSLAPVRALSLQKKNTPHTLTRRPSTPPTHGLTTPERRPGRTPCIHSLLSHHTLTHTAHTQKTPWNVFIFSLFLFPSFVDGWTLSPSHL